jgi:hypothetical protein
MSLEDVPDATLDQKVGRLETLRSEWAISMTREAGREIDANFRVLSEEIEQMFGDEGERAVAALLAKHQGRHAPLGR